jgi:hypothetical protein
MAKYSPPVKAYKNQEFLSSADGRTIRILSEYYEPRARFAKNKIVDTIVFFGSARLVSRKDALKLVESAKKENSSSSKKNFERAVKILEMSKYYEEAVELSKKLTDVVKEIRQ